MERQQAVAQDGEREPEPPLSWAVYRKAATVARVSFSTREL
jgi:hypothetical protein